MTDLIPSVMLITSCLFVLVLVQLALLLRSRNYTVLLLWPALIYLIGPLFTLLFAEHPVLSRYVKAERVISLTFEMIWYIELIIIADKVFDLSTPLQNSLAGERLIKLSSRPMFAPIFVGAMLIAAALQIETLRSFGSIFSGSYVLSNVADGLIPYWGFLSGLYEIVFLCFVLLLIGQRPQRHIWHLYITLYCATTLLRILGGTRLILIKELAFMVILFYLRGSITPRRLLIAGAAVVGLGTLVGLLRTNGTSEGSALFGPLYGLVIESALNALTLSIADQVNQAGYVAQHGDTLTAITFYALSMLPSFLRVGLTEKDMDSMNPTNLALYFGFDTAMPVGGMSGFATVNYLSSYPFLFIFIMVATFAIWFRWLKNDAFKQMLGLVIAINPIHFWRDPADIAFKLLAQGMAICGALYLFRPRSKRGIVAASEPPQRVEQELL